MKKIFCLVLVALVLTCVFTGCAGPIYTAERNMINGMYDKMEKGDRSNVSTSRNGTVNGRNRDGGLMDKAGTINGKSGNDYTKSHGTR